jgi:hypothetical protein
MSKPIVLPISSVVSRPKKVQMIADKIFITLTCVSANDSKSLRMALWKLKDLELPQQPLKIIALHKVKQLWVVHRHRAAPLPTTITKTISVTTTTTTTTILRLWSDSFVMDRPQTPNKSSSLQSRTLVLKSTIFLREAKSA